MYVYEDICIRVDVYALYASHHVAQLTAMIIAMHITISDVSPNFLAINFCSLLTSFLNKPQAVRFDSRKLFCNRWSNYSAMEGKGGGEGGGGGVEGQSTTLDPSVTS